MMSTVFATLGILVLCGIVYRRIPGVPDPLIVRRVIGSIVLNVFVPLLTFGVVSTTPLSSDLWSVPLVSITSVVLGFAMSWVVFARLLRSRLATETIGALIIASTWCNAMYLGLPITTAIVGYHVGHVPILYDYLGMTPLLFILGTVVAVEYGRRGEKHTLRAGLMQALQMPPTIAVGLGVLMNVAQIPIAPFILDVCASAGKTVAPLMLFSIGLALHFPRLSTLPILAPVALIRCILVPIAVYPFIGAVSSSHDVARAVVLESAMPTMMLTMVFAERYGLDESALAQAILVTTLVSVATLPFVAQWPF